MLKINTSVVKGPKYLERLWWDNDKRNLGKVLCNVNVTCIDVFVLIEV